MKAAKCDNSGGNSVFPANKPNQFFSYLPIMKDEAPSIKELHDEAKKAEANGDTVSAIQLYKEILKQDALYINAYNSLMKLYRRAKEYKKELAIINQAIKNYEAYYKKHQPRHRKSVDDISRKLNKALGLTDKNSNALYSPEPIAGWKKRRLVVEKRL